MSDDLDFLKKTDKPEEKSKDFSLEGVLSEIAGTLQAFEGRLKGLEDHVIFLLAKSPDYRELVERNKQKVDQDGSEKE